VGGGANLEVAADAPLVGVDPLGDAGAAQSLQPPDMGVDETFVVTANHVAIEPRPLQMAARPVDAVFGHAGDGAVGGADRALRRSDLDDAANAGVLDAGGLDAGDMVRLPVDPRHGPITATAIAAIAPPAETFAKGRDFAAWLGLVPKQASTGGKQKLGAISKMGERTLRRLLIIGSSAVVLQASKRGAPAGSWLEGMLARKPRMLVTVALANKMARTVWALLVRQEDYRAPVAVTA